MRNREFEFAAGSIALDFADTVAARSSEPVELLSSPARLDAWIEAAGLAGAGAARASSGDLEKAVLLREAIFRSAVRTASGTRVDRADIDFVNGIAARPDLRPQLVEGAVTLVAKDTLSAVFATIAADAVRCLGENVGRLKQCPDCRMVFRDNSPPGRRIWCSSASGCGNRAKVRRHRTRHANEGNDRG